jgi:fructan beta-fructosidase
MSRVSNRLVPVLVALLGVIPLSPVSLPAAGAAAVINTDADAVDTAADTAADAAANADTAADAAADSAANAAAAPAATPQFRPAFHFTPRANWMNDPNGMVYVNGEYHLFFQYYPDATVWGPMHWGHAKSRDLLHWEELPVALYPDERGWIFSGSIVVDADNTSGFGRDGIAPWVAIFTHHDGAGVKAGRQDVESQSLAYSLDGGTTWTQYAGNPVLPSPGTRHFRDPKVFRHEPSGRWVMSLATKDRITFFSSANLKEWRKESEFGATLGAHGGVWECPDLFPMVFEGKTRWVLLVSLNPGGPNGGSATQYFVGDFDGKTFTPLNAEAHWLDYGPDNYAGVTFGNNGGRALFMGWLGNWNYALKVPTHPWRSAMTLPRDLHLQRVGSELRLVSQPAREVDGLGRAEKPRVPAGPGHLVDFTQQTGDRFQWSLQLKQLEGLRITLASEAGDELEIGYDAKRKEYFIDRRRAGNTGFSEGFAGRFTAPRVSTAVEGNITLVVDATSVELFADGGLTVMTALSFPKAPYQELRLRKAGERGLVVERMELARYAGKQ